MAVDWISASKAIHYVGHGLGLEMAAIAICKRAHAGLLQTSAKTFFYKQEKRSDCLIPPKFWWAEGHEALTQNWVSGDFSTWIEQKHELQAFGVRFDFGQISELLPANLRAAAMASISAAYDSNWLSARAARKLVYESGGIAPTAAAPAILAYCKTGHINAVALQMQMLSSRPPSEPFEQEREWDVPNWYWEDVKETKSFSTNWETGTFSAGAWRDGKRTWVILNGVYFSRQSLSVLVPSLLVNSEGTASPVIASADVDNPTSLPPLPESDLQKWWISHASVREGLTKIELLTLIRAANPKHFISRDRIRDLAGDRKTGPKPFGGKESAE